jgi:serine/threonine protein kinase
MAEVFLAERRGADGFVREVVIKRILPELAGQNEFVDLFRDEARITASLRHGNIVQVLEFQQVDGQYALVLEYVDGTSLAAVLAHTKSSVRTLPFLVIAHLLSEVARALDYAHRKVGPDGSPLKVIHRDVSPANVLVSRDGEVKLADFGIARAASRITATSGGIRGKLDYLAPEALEGAPVQASDLYALGMMGWEMCTHEPAFPADGLEARMRRILTEEVPPLVGRVPDVPPALADAIAALVRRRPGDRPARGMDVVHALLPLVQGAPVAEMLAARVAALAPGPPVDTDLTPARRPSSISIRSAASEPTIARGGGPPAGGRRATPAGLPGSTRTSSLRPAGPPGERTPLPSVASPSPDPTGLEPLAARGAENLALRCLEVLHTERVCLFLQHAGPAGRLVERALRDAGADLTVIDVEDADLPSFGTDRVLRALERCTASVALSPEMSPELSVAIVRAVRAANVRHIHMPRADLRVLATSVRADPSRLERLNEIAVGCVETARTLRVVTGRNAELSVRLQTGYPLVADAGRPLPGRWDNLPSGFVFFHTGSVAGSITIDRLISGNQEHFDARALRRSPLELTFRRGAVDSVTCADPEIEAAVRRYLDHHPDAGRVGFVSFPTNYLALAEIQHPHHDALMPGIRLQLGFSDASSTGAPFDLDRGLRLVPRRASVWAGDVLLVDKGRFTGPLAEAASSWARG